MINLNTFSKFSVKIFSPNSLCSDQLRTFFVLTPPILLAQSLVNKTSVKSFIKHT